MNEEPRPTIADIREAVKALDGLKIPATHFLSWEGCRFVWWVNDQTGECGLYGGATPKGETLKWTKPT